MPPIGNITIPGRVLEFTAALDDQARHFFDKTGTDVGVGSPERFGYTLRMRIGIDVRLIHYRPGGIAEYVRHLVNELAALDPVNDYFVLHHFRSQETITPAPNFRRVNILTPAHHRLERWTLALELARLRLDLFQTPDAILPQRGGRRHVITVHDLHYLHYPQFMTADSRRYYVGNIARAVHMADHLLVSSHATKDDLTNLLDVPVEKMTVHKLGVNPAFRPLATSEITACRDRLNLPQTYILFVGTFEPRKNIPGLLKAYQILNHSWPDTPPLVMVGRRGWLYDEIFDKIAELHLQDRIIWLENAAFDALPAIYNGASVLALPSYYEGFGLTALEAMACGTPPVASDRSSLPEVVGDAGLLINPDDPESIAASLRRVLEDTDLCQELARAGLARAATFTWRETAETALRVYRQVLSF